MPWIACSDPALLTAATPANVAGDLRALGYQMAARGTPGWRTLHAGEDAVKVDHPAAAPPELHTAAELLRAAGWPRAEVTGDGWVRVTGPRATPVPVLFPGLGHAGGPPRQTL